MLSDFEKEKVFWTRKMNLKLVNFIKKRPYIWNPKHPKYTTSGSYRDKTYLEFSKRYGEELTQSAVKDRWTNIRSTFTSYLRKVRTAQQNNETYEVNWHLLEHCQFLLKASRIKLKERVTITEDYSDTLETDEKDDRMKILGSNLDTECDTVANNLRSIFQQYQNDSFGCNNTDNDQIGRMVSDKLSMMESKEAAIMSVKIMQILSNYECNGTS